MKQRSTTPVSGSSGLATKSALVASAVLMVLAAPLAMTPTARAEDYEAKISALQKQIDSYDKKAGRLGKKADGLQATLDKISGQKAAIQSQLELTQQKYILLQKQIKATAKKLGDNKNALGEIIASLYVEGETTPLEMLASSKNIGDFLDKQTYQSSTRDQLSSTVNEVKNLQKKLEGQKTDLQRTLADQKNARTALAAKEDEQAKLVAKTRGSEASYKKLSQESSAQKLQLQQEQQAAIQAAMARAAAAAPAGPSGGGGGGVTVSPGSPSMGGYPWAGGCTVDANAISSGTDPLGYGCRQCVSYTAWKVYQKTGYAPRWWGNANMWPGSARAAGFKVSSTPRANAIGVISAGAYGHTVYIEDYNPSTGMARISQMNYLNAGGPGWGNYSEMTLPAGTYDTFIYL